MGWEGTGKVFQKSRAKSTVMEWDQGLDRGQRDEWNLKVTGCLKQESRASQEGKPLFLSPWEPRGMAY